MFYADDGTPFVGMIDRAVYKTGIPASHIIPHIQTFAATVPYLHPENKPLAAKLAHVVYFPDQNDNLNNLRGVLNFWR